jgi:hypothetical protein
MQYESAFLLHRVPIHRRISMHTIVLMYCHMQTAIKCTSFSIYNANTICHSATTTSTTLAATIATITAIIITLLPLSRLCSSVLYSFEVLPHVTIVTGSF